MLGAIDFLCLRSSGSTLISSVLEINLKIEFSFLYGTIFHGPDLMDVLERKFPFFTAVPISYAGGRERRPDLFNARREFMGRLQSASSGQRNENFLFGGRTISIPSPEGDSSSRFERTANGDKHKQRVALVIKSRAISVRGARSLLFFRLAFRPGLSEAANAPIRWFEFLRDCSRFTYGVSGPFEERRGRGQSLRGKLKNGNHFQNTSKYQLFRLPCMHLNYFGSC